MKRDVPQYSAIYNRYSRHPKRQAEGLNFDQLSTWHRDSYYACFTAAIAALQWYRSPSNDHYCNKCSTFIIYLCESFSCKSLLTSHWTDLMSTFANKKWSPRLSCMKRHLPQYYANHDRYGHHPNKMPLLPLIMFGHTTV